MHLWGMACKHTNQRQLPITCCFCESQKPLLDLSGFTVRFYSKMFYRVCWYFVFLKQRGPWPSPAMLRIHPSGWSMRRRCNKTWTCDMLHGHRCFAAQFRQSCPHAKEIPDTSLLEDPVAKCNQHVNVTHVRGPIETRSALTATTQDLCNGIYIARIQHLLRTEYKLYYQARNSPRQRTSSMTPMLLWTYHFEVLKRYVLAGLGMLGMLGMLSMLSMLGIRFQVKVLVFQ